MTALFIRYERKFERVNLLHSKITVSTICSQGNALPNIYEFFYIYIISFFSAREHGLNTQLFFINTENLYLIIYFSYTSNTWDWCYLTVHKYNATYTIELSY